MKKAYLLVITLLGVVLLTGCGGKGNVYTCQLKQSVDSGGYSIQMKADVNLELNSDDNVSGASMDYTISVPGEAYDELKKAGDVDKQMDSLGSYFEKAVLNQLGDTSMIKKSSYKVDGKDIVLTFEFDMSKATQLRSKEEAKTYFEGQNFKCE